MKVFSSKILWSVIIVCILITISIALFDNKGKPVSTKKITNAELTIKEAYLMALKKAIEWDDNAKLESISSVDDELEPNTNNNAGSNGKRRKWNMNFVIPTKDKSLSISISDGSITNSIEGKDNVQKSEAINPKEIAFDSPKFLKKAIQRYQLKPGEIWAQGYHFTIHKYDGKVFFTVVGLSVKRYFTKVSWDATSGELMDAIEKRPKGGGVFIVKNNKGIPISTSNQINGIASSKNNKVMIYWGYGFVNGVGLYEQPIFKITRDNGKSWSDFDLIHKKEDVIEAWFAKNNEIYMASSDNLYVTTNHKGLRKLLNVDSTIIDLYHNGSTISVLTQKNIFTTDDGGKNWTTMLPPNESQKVVQINGTLFVMTNQGEILKNHLDKWESITTDKEIVIDVTDSQNRLLASLNDGTLKQYDVLNEQKWKPLPSDQIPKNNLFSCDESERRGCFYAIEDEQVLYKYIKKGDGEWKKSKIFAAEEGVITGILDKENKQYITVSPSFEWMTIK